MIIDRGKASEIVTQMAEARWTSEPPQPWPAMGILALAIMLVDTRRRLAALEAAVRP